MFIKKIELEKPEYSEYYGTDYEKTIKLDKVNILIGKNNSGKSRLARKIILNDCKNVYYKCNDVDLIIQLKEQIKNILKGASSRTVEEILKTYLFKEEITDNFYINLDDEKKFLDFIISVIHRYSSTTDILNSAFELNIIQNKSDYAISSDISSDSHILRDDSIKVARIYLEVLRSTNKLDVKTLYFPSLLSLRKLDCSNEEGRYSENLSKLFQKSDFDRKEIIEINVKTGQELYNDLRKQLLGLNEDRKKFLNYEEFVGSNFFDSRAISIFVKDEDKDIYIKVGDEKEYPIYKLGEGFQTLLTITYYLYMNDDMPLKICLDEPEIHLHPGLQRLLISKMHEYKNCQFIISTHSSSFIDICDEFDEDTSIICVEKSDNNKKAYNSSYDDMDLYKLIGVRPSSLILSNCTIWVEGPTDIFYIDTFLKLYIKMEKKENFKLGYNYNYAFNGSINIASKMDFKNTALLSSKVKKLSKNNFVIFDSDNLSEENLNYEKIKKIQQELGENSSHVMGAVKTIENIIPPKILRKYFEEKYKPNEKKLGELVLSFFDEQEANYSKREYKKKNIPDSLAEYVFNKKSNKTIEDRREYFKRLWSSNKYDISLFFSDYVNNLSDMQAKDFYKLMIDDFKKMIIKIYDFIDRNN